VVRSRGRLSRSEDFARVYRAGRSVANKYLVLYYFERPTVGTTDSLEDARIGFSVSKRLGGAVDRNRVKRVLREVCRAHVQSLKENMDYVLIARTPLMGLLETEGFQGVEAKTMEVFRKAGLLSIQEGTRQQ